MSTVITNYTVNASLYTCVTTEKEEIINLNRPVGTTVSTYVPLRAPYGALGMIIECPFSSSHLLQSSLLS